MAFSKPSGLRTAKVFAQPQTNLNRSVILLGTTGNGKSTLGNFILGSDNFHVCKGVQLMSVTSTSAEARVNHHGREIHVIDTPGFRDTRKENRDNLLYDIGQAILMAKDGAHAIYICVNLRNRFTDADMATLGQIEELGNLWNYAMVVFMNASMLGQSPEEQERELKSMLSDPRQCPEALTDLMRKVGGRHVLVEGSDLGNSRYRDQKLTQLLEMTDAIFQENREQKYNNRLFEIAKNFYEAAMEELRRERLSTKSENGGALPRMQQESRAMEEQFRRQIDELHQLMAENKRKYKQMRKESRAAHGQHQLEIEKMRQESQARETQSMRDEISRLQEMRQESQARETQSMRDEMSRLQGALSLATQSRGHHSEPTPEAVRERAYEKMKPKLEEDTWTEKALNAAGRGAKWAWNKAKDKCSVM